MTHARVPGKFTKGEAVMVPATVVHEYGGEDAGWVRVRVGSIATSHTAVVNADTLVKKSDLTGGGAKW